MEYIGCSIEQETEERYDVSVEAADGSSYRLEVAKDLVRSMRLPFQSDTFPGNSGLLSCEVLEKTDTTAVVSTNGEPASVAARMEVPLRLLAKRM